MNILSIVTPLIFFATGTVVEAASSFDLLCAGNVERADYEGNTSEPYQARYRVDLSQAKWCEGDCKALFDIASVQPGYLVLESKRSDDPSYKTSLSNTINRETGVQEVTAISSMPRQPWAASTMKWTGKCERAPFSGFPKFDTKF